MQVTQKTQLNLIDPFFDKELDYKNDYVSYITVGGNSSVTPKNNNSISSQNKKYHRSIDNPLRLVCHVLFPFINSVNPFESIMLRSSEQGFFLFISPDYSQHDQYLRDYKNFSVFDLQKVS